MMFVGKVEKDWDLKIVEDGSGDLVKGYIYFWLALVFDFYF